MDSRRAATLPVWSTEVSKVTLYPLFEFGTSGIFKPDVQFSSPCSKPGLGRVMVAVALKASVDEILTVLPVEAVEFMDALGFVIMRTDTTIAANKPSPAKRHDTLYIRLDFIAPRMGREGPRTEAVGGDMISVSSDS